MVEPHQASLEHISSREAYQRQMEAVVDQDGLLPLLPMLPGEQCRYLGSSGGAGGSGTCLITNYRFVFARAQVLASDDVVLPLGLIEAVEARDLFTIVLLRKDGQSHLLSFTTNETCSRWLARLKECVRPAKTFTDYFACAYRAWLPGSEGGTDVAPAGGGEADDFLLQTAINSDGMSYGAYSFGKEMDRLGFDLSNVWRITQVNKDYELCDSYPDEILVPKSIDDNVVKDSAAFRSLARFPAVVWRSRSSGAVLARSSQPLCGLLAWRSVADEQLFAAIAESAVKNAGSVDDERVAGLKRIQIVDARPFAHAQLNRAKGGGIEFPEYYPNTDMEYMGLPNIHNVRKSFADLRALLLDSARSQDFESSSWLSMLDATRWIYNLSLVLKAAAFVVQKLRQPRCVLVHCSDGWDRTPQIVSLAELLADPYYRTCKGFQCLVEKEWLAYGHKFADRCGHCTGSVNQNEVSPVFLQWIDCVYQIHRQYPCAFEFSEDYLVKLAEHTYSCMFGTFLVNKRNKPTLKAATRKTVSVWAYLETNKDTLRNYLFNPSYCPDILEPSWYARDLYLWRGLYLPSRNVFSSTVIRGESRVQVSLSSMSSTKISPAQEHSLQPADEVLLPKSEATCSAECSLNTPSTELSPDRGEVRSKDFEDDCHCESLMESRTAVLPLPGSDGASATSSLGSPQSSCREGEMQADAAVAESGAQDNSGLHVCKPEFIGPDGLILRPRGDEAVVRRLREAEDRVRHLERMLHARLYKPFLAADGKLSSLSRQSATDSQYVTSPSSSGGESESASSWEDVDAKDAFTLWVPDEQVSHCSGCSRAFTYSRRKHHCRSCGFIYCHDCAHDYLPLPQQQLYDAVRVCHRCSELQRQQEAKTAESMEAIQLDSTEISTVSRPV